MGRGGWSVGIDLGTTHTVVARGAPSTPVELFRVPQLTASSLVESLPLLPSVLFAALPGEEATDPFSELPFVVGEWARKRAKEVPGRAITSAKSWLSHRGVDREGAILPWSTSHGEDDDSAPVPRISPVEASARLLRHVHRTYNDAFPNAPIEQAQVTLTVPASFDEVARALTLRAATMAGLDVRLLEEPQAAFYDYLASTDPTELKRHVEAAGGELLTLVCDVGGGTTDLSLIAIRAGANAASADAVEVERLSVGNHLLLGGDNMDLALAHSTEPAVAGGGANLDAASFEQWVMQCRIAKETLLGEGAPNSFRAVLARRGSQMVGGTRGADITREAVAELILEGFFPQIERGAPPPLARRSAVVAHGLPYEREVAITRHIVQFLDRHANGRQVSALLLNGGVVKAKSVAERITAVVSNWNRAPVHLFDYPHPDYAVARGAVAYGLSVSGHGVRIGGGSSRGYYIGIEASGGGRPKAVCVVPQGAVEGERHVVRGRAFQLAVGRAVRFDLYAADTGTPHATGDIVTVDDDFDRLPPLSMRIAGATHETERAVHLEGELTAVGTLDLACVANDDESPIPARFRLEFQLSEGEEAATNNARRLSDESLALVERAFGKPRADASGREARDLLRDLEAREGDRQQWSAGVARALYDALIPLARGRRRSPDHERIFFLLTGYCLRPGFGCVGDEERVQAFAPLIEQRLTFPNEARGWTQFWVACRRVAPGLNEAVQTQLRDIIDPWLMPPETAPKKARKGSIGSPSEVLEVASFLERVATIRRSELGTWILERTWTSREPVLWTALGRIGARVPSYASAHYVVSPLIAELWIDHALREKWTDLPAAGRAAASIARLTGDRTRDVSLSSRKDVARKLASSGADPALIALVTEVVPMREKERVVSLGDSLPIGLRLSGTVGDQPLADAQSEHRH